MKKIRRATALWFAVALTACTGIKVSTDYDPDFDFGSLETYDWAPEFEPGSARLGARNDLLHNRIRTSIVSQLNTRGFRAQTDPQPDVWVAYHIGIDRKIEAETMYHQHTGWGGRGYARGGYGQAQTVVREYSEGTLVIDLLRPGSGELLWRGSGVVRLKERKTPEARAKAIDEAVGAILEKLR